LACLVFAGASAAAGSKDAVPLRSSPTNVWSFRPIVRPEPPVAAPRTSKFASAIDRFVIARLHEQGVELAPPAGKAVLLRRATFDLHGLPPTPAELDEFLADKSPDAFARVIDRLLASPRYGERWARHWLDLARFSESDGYEYDKMRDHAWRYRDYLIDSLNADKPYARFVREQIAGDAQAPGGHDGIIATGFLTAGPYDEAGNSSASDLLKARIREEEMEDMIAAVSQTFLAVTVNCARCHDHKFDPVPQRDYYRLKAALDGVRHGSRPLLTATEAKERATRTAELKTRIAAIEKEISEIEARAGIVALKEARRRRSDTGTSVPSANPPLPLARWSFEQDARDSLGGLHGELAGGAKITNGRLQLDGTNAFVRTAPLAMPLREKTLEVWVTLASLAQQGGGAISIETPEGGTFDAIVFGERTPRKWAAGSSFFQRTRDLMAPDELAHPGEPIHLAAVYRSDNSIALYRNGKSYGEAYTPSGPNAELQTYPPGQSRLLFGLRHTGAGNGFLAGEVEEARLYDRALSEEEILASARSTSVPSVSPEELTQAMGSERQRRELLRAELSDLRQSLKTMPAAAAAYVVVSRQPAATFLLARGDVEKKREQVTAGGLSAVETISPEFGLSADEPEGQRRARLADWITDRDNPLTWRVIVNRVWHHHFGRGIVGTPNDFGVNGERPSHPGLLDWLAFEFLAQGGSLKKLHRLIMTSAVYQQGSVATEVGTDVENRLLSRFPLRRLEAESVRDAMLSVSGQLNLQMGGPGFRPFKVTVSGSHFYELTDPIGPEFNRRTIYRMNVQSGKDPLLDSLDCPDPSTKTPARSTTTTPLQSLGLMNSAFVQRQCRHFAERLEKEAGSKVEAQIALGYRLAFGRSPRRGETKLAVALAREHGLESVCWTLFNASEFLYVR
jgi:hypothetical protein